VDDQRHVVGQRPLGMRVARADDTLAPLDLEADRREQGVQHRVGLKAVTPATAVHDPSHQGARLERLGLAQLYGEILVGHARDERSMHHPQSGGVGRGHPGQSDMAQEPVAGGAVERQGRLCRVR
jgi:hypothetical protein